MNEEFIVWPLNETIGDAAAGDLLEAVPDLKKLQREIINIQLFSKEKDLENPQVLLKKFRDIVYDYEDAVDEYVTRSGILVKHSCAAVPLLNKLWERSARRFLRRSVKAFSERLKPIAKTLELCNNRKAVLDSQIKEWSNQDLFVGRVSDLNKLKSSLLDNADFSTVSILGVGGIGKTVLAKKLYSGSRNQFQSAAWVTVSDKLDFKSLLQQLMLQLTMETHEKVLTLSEIDLLLQLHRIQLNMKCLIVIDDICSTDAWLNLQIAFPSKESGSITKVLVTTRSREVAHMVAANSGILHLLKGLSEDESWKLIASIALPPGHKLDASMELIGKEIARKCNGLPLAIRLLGEHLGRKRTLADWCLLNQNIVLDKWKGEQERDVMQQLLALIFVDLPANLRHCLFYLAAFLENSEIDTDKLYMLWIAEGLVQSRYGELQGTATEIAGRYLQELVSRSMVEVVEDEIARVRKFRSCRLHSMIRDMSLLRAKEENFFTVMDLRPTRQSTSGSTGKMRKVATHLGGNKGGCSISFGQKKTSTIHSLLLLDTCRPHHKCFQEESLCMLKFKVLRVLHLDGLNFGVGKFPKHIENLVFLRYLSFRNCYLEKLPPSIGKLLNLQTLDLRVRKGCLMTIHNVLRKMGRMKHLYLPHLFRVHNDEKLRLDTLRELETLENFNSKLCFAEDLLQLVNLRFLTASIYENLEDLEATIKCINTTSNYLCEASLDIRCFHCYPKGKQVAIQKLFQCNGLNSLHLEGYLGKLPLIASSSLSVMLFSSSEFDQDPMPMLGKLPNLRVLVLYNYAFLGKKLSCPTLSFSELRHLKLSTLPNLENLIVEEGTMPKLSGLTIEECENLKLHSNQLKFLKNLKQTKIRGIAEAFEELQVGGETLQDVPVI